jgi:hypothetical protein
MGWGYADTVRKHLRVLGADGREVANKELAAALDLVSDADKRSMYRVLSDFRKQNEIRRVRPGVYVYAGKATGDDELRQKLWRVFRRLRTVTADDLVELTGASENYAKEFLRMLVKRDVARRIDDPGRQDKSKYQMITDPVKMPENEEKARRMRKMRRQKRREALVALHTAEMAIKKARECLIDEPGSP